MKNLRLQVTVPSTQHWNADFGVCMCHLTAGLSHQIPEFDSQVFVIHNTKGSILANMRQRAISIALEKGMTHVLFIDSDQTFPHDLAHRLLAHKKHIVACNVATKSIPSTPTARQKGKDFYETIHQN